ncbi:hypothetical protein P8452_44540 [Trifolium repens]|nr:hypothetical protein P8452_44540 [Trifolium repens]
MVSQFWASRREMTQNNGRTRPSDERNGQSEPTNQVANIHLATNNHFRTPQGIPQSFEGHPVILNNFTQGGRRDNNVVDVGTAPMVPFSLSGNNMTPVIPSTRYGQILSPSIPSDPRLYMDLHKINPYCAKSVKNSSSNGVDFQGYALGFPNTFGPSVNNRTNFRYHPYGEGSNRMNNSSLFNDFNPLRSVNLTSLNGVKDDVIPTSNPPPYHPLQRKALDMFCSSGNAGGDSTCDIASKSSNINPYHAKSVQKSSSNGVDFQGYALGFPNSVGPSVHNQKNFRYNPYGEGSSRINDSLLFNNFNPRLNVDLDRSNCATDVVLPTTTPHFDRLRQTNNLYKSCSSNNDVKDLICDRASKSCAFNIRDTEAWKRLKSLTSPDDCFKAVQTKGKELPIFKDLKNAIPTSSVAETDDDNENVDEKLDLELKL